MIKLIKPYIAFNEVEEEFQEIFETGWFTRGKYVDIFVDEIKRYTGARFAFLTTSATTALWMCLKLLEIGRGDEVIVSDFSFPATANVVEDLGAIPIFADVSLETFNMIPQELENKITSRTKAVIFVDALGSPSGLHAIQSICRQNKIPLIEDAACAIGSSERGTKCGNIADITCFSFHPRKLLTTGEGGAIATNNDTWAKKLALKLSHGAIMENGKFDFIDYGYNFRLPELQAVMGIKQLAKLDTIVRARNMMRDAYIQRLESVGFDAQRRGEGVVHNIQSLVFKVPRHVDRDILIAKLKTEGIETTLGTYCLSGTTVFKKKYNNFQKNSAFLEKNTITLPCHSAVDIDFVCDKVRSCI